MGIWAERETQIHVYCVMSAIEKPQRPHRRDEEDLSVKERKTVESLLPDDCRWPIGDPQHRDFHFCGKRRADGDPYCAAHMREGFQVARPRLPKLPRSFLRHT